MPTIGRLIRISGVFLGLICCLLLALEVLSGGMPLGLAVLVGLAGLCGAAFITQS